MNIAPTVLKNSVYLLVVILSLTAIWLVLNAPPDFINTRAVYQGF
jgi:hypothetical protein